MKLKKTVSGSLADATDVLEASLNVKVAGASTTIVLRSIAQKNARYQITFSTEVWREFCRRQLATPPPPLPKGEASC
jgi:hypothetical protein